MPSPNRAHMHTSWPVARLGRYQELSTWTETVQVLWDSRRTHYLPRKRGCMLFCLWITAEIVTSCADAAS